MLIGIKSFISGSKAILTKPELRPYLLVPIVINILVYAIVSITGIYFFNDWLGRLLPTGDSWYLQIARFFAWITFAIFLFMIIVLTFITIANIIASPFNDTLSSLYEENLTNKKVQNSSSHMFIIKQECKRVLLYISIMLILGVISLVLSFIPIINILIPIFWFLFSSLMLTFEYLSFPMDRQETTLLSKINFIKTNLYNCISFGSITFICLLIPVISIIIIPIAVLGGTNLFITLSKEKHLNIVP